MKGYDNWKLESPYDNERDIFESDLPTFYSTDELVLEKFEMQVRELAKSFGIVENEGDL